MANICLFVSEYIDKYSHGYNCGEYSSIFQYIKNNPKICIMILVKYSDGTVYLALVTLKKVKRYA